nr:hypothetical protein [uncultured Halomonas sp.]
MTIFQSLNTEDLCKRVHSAQKRVAFIGPSMTIEMAVALSNKFKQLSGSGITIIIDYNEATFRLGYGHHDAIETLQESGIELRKESGLRISALIIDDRGWVLHQSPMAVEDPNAPVYNALALSPEQMKEICVAAGIKDGNPEQPATSQNSSASPKPPEIGRALIPESEYKAVKQSINSNPPQSFDLQRQVNVYTANLQFVDIELAGGRVESRTIRLPTDLQKQLFGSNGVVDSRLKASYKLLDSPQLKGLEEIRLEVEELRKYTRQLNKRLGRVMLKARKDDFQKKQIQLEEKIFSWKESAKAIIDSEIEKSINDLAIALAPLLLKNPPIELLSGLIETPGDDHAIDYIKSRLYRIAPDSSRLVEDLKLHCIFKDVTYEMLKNDEFQKKIGELYPDLKARIMEEFKTAKARHSPVAHDLFS